MDKIEEAFKKACEKGRFSRESYFPYEKGLERAEHPVHEVGFIAYDGRHVTAYGKTAAEADRITTTLNHLGSVDAVNEWLSKHRTGN